MTWDEVIRTLGSAGTLVAVLIAAQQLFLNRRQIRAGFEDDLSREYRSISRELPADAFFADADASVPLTTEQLNAMFRYFDLSNEQLRYCDQGRVSSETAAAWRAGISDNLKLPRFAQAWHAITPRLAPTYYTELYKLKPPAVSRGLHADAPSASESPTGTETADAARPS